MNMFDESIENLSDLVQKFSRKSKRIKKIFDDDEEDENQINEKSYGMRLVSLNKIDENIPKHQTSSENETNTSQNTNHNVKALSPVPIIEAPNNEITESRRQFKVSSQQKNESLRRSLFKQPTSSQMSNIAIICSTPCTNNELNQNIFFGFSNKTIENLSPIRKGLSSTDLKEDDMNGIIMPIASQKNNAALDNVVPVNSLQNLEIDLREQFQIDQKTPKKSYSKSAIVEKSIRINENKNMISSSQSKAASTVKNPYVIIEHMDISTEAISLYRKNQMKRLSTSNRTNINTFNMIETPIVHKEKQSIIKDSLLEKKLAICESDSDLTEDDSEKQKTPKRSAVRQENQKNSMPTENKLTNDESNNDPKPESNYKNTDDMARLKKASPQNSVEALGKRSMDNIKKKDTKITGNNKKDSIESSDKSENEIVGPKSPDKNKKVCDNTNKADRFYKSCSETSIECVPPESESGVSENKEITNSKNNQDQQSNIDTNQIKQIFKKPNPTRKNKYKKLTCNDLESSANSMMPPAIIQSVREFMKHTNETSTTSETGSKSLKINRPKRKTKTKGTKNNEKLKDYMALDNKLTNAKGKNKDKKEKRGKRTLYTQKSYIEDEKEQQQPESIVSTQNDANDSDAELITTVDEKRKSLDSMSNASSQGFDHPKSPEIKRGRSRPQKQKASDAAGASKVKNNKTRKRQNESADEDEPPSKTNRLAVNRDDDEKNNSGDEGFQSNDDVSFDNIRYDPYKNGCTRPGLRVRRYRRPYWIGASKVCNYGVTFGLLTKDDVKAIQYQKKHHISEHDILQRNPFDMYMAPSDRMDHFREIVAKRKKNNDAKSESGSTSKRTKTTESVASIETLAEAMTRTIDNYSRLPKNGENSAQTFASPEFDFTQINHLNWINIGDGVLYSCFVEGGLDGFIKFEKGALKARSKTKCSVVKLTVLCGKIKITVNTTSMDINNLGFATIYKGQTYSIQNSKDDVAVVLINRFYKTKQTN